MSLPFPPYGSAASTSNSSESSTQLTGARAATRARPTQASTATVVRTRRRPPAGSGRTATRFPSCPWSPAPPCAATPKFPTDTTPTATTGPSQTRTPRTGRARRAAVLQPLFQVPDVLNPLWHTSGGLPLRAGERPPRDPRATRCRGAHQCPPPVRVCSGRAFFTRPPTPLLAAPRRLAAAPGPGAQCSHHRSPNSIGGLTARGIFTALLPHQRGHPSRL